MIKILTSIFILAASYTSSAQTIQKSILNTQGGTFKSTTATMRTSVGEPIVYSLSKATGVSISQGFFTGNKERSLTKIEEVAAEKITVYPNPFTNQITVKLSSLENAKVEIYNLIGEKVYDSPFSHEVLQLNGLASGAYLLKTIQKNNTVSITKIIKQ